MNTTLSSSQLLSFLSEGSGFDYHLASSHLDTPYGPSSFPYTGTADDFSSLKPAFSIGVCHEVFQSLICQGVAKKQDVVTLKAYESIKKIIDGLDDNKAFIKSEGQDSESLYKEFRELLWSIALTSDSDEVVDSAGFRLLNMYTQANGAKFVDSVFKAMSQDIPHAPTVNRCMKLLTAAMKCGVESQYEKIIYRLSAMNEADCRAVVSSVPHGLKSAACKKSVTVELKWLDQHSAARQSLPQSYALQLTPSKPLNWS